MTFKLSYLKSIHDNLEKFHEKDLIITPFGIFNGLTILQYSRAMTCYLRGKNIQCLGVVIDDSPEMYCAILGALFSGVPFVPINPEYPYSRISSIIAVSEIDALWMGRVDLIRDDIYSFTFDDVGMSVIENEILLFDDSTRNAYILFTSGSTGEPKGVAISHNNLQSFILGFNDMEYNLTDEDRFLQMFDLTFDLSVASFILPLINGCSFYTIDKDITRAFAVFDVLERYKITFALMVPSVLNSLKAVLKMERLENLRYSQFCGEILKVDQCLFWKTIAPNSFIDNVYGPTEATIFCSGYRIKDFSDIAQINGVVSIGLPMKHVLFDVLEGELFIGGGQVTSGYLQKGSNFSHSFSLLGNERYYRSGDRVIYKNGNYFVLGRLDSQVKIQGYRVELSEVEHVFSKIFNVHCVAIVSVTGFLVLFFIDLEHRLLINEIMYTLEKELPFYMRPRYVIRVDQFPLNANGKIDRHELRKQIVES